MIRHRRGSAMPMVLFGMALAILIATLAWNRAWTRRTVSAHADIAWQAQLLAESGTACALQEALARVGAQTPKSPAASPASKDLAKKTTALAPAIVILDTADTACEFHRQVSGEMSWDEPAGTQLLSIRATGTVSESGAPLKTSMSSTWGGNPPPGPFADAISLWAENGDRFQLSGRREGSIYERSAPPVPGTKDRRTESFQQFFPLSLAADTTFAISRMAAAFRSDDARLGGETFTPGRPPPDRDSLVYTIGDVIFDAPWAGNSWDAGHPRILFVEGRVELRGRLKMNGWTIYAKGPVVIQDDAEVVDLGVFSTGGVMISDRAKVSGQILSAGVVGLSGEARLTAPTFAACWRGKGRDSVARFALANRAQAEAYVVALGDSAEIRIAQGSTFRGVAVSGGVLRNDGRIEGVAVSRRQECGQASRNCSNGTFIRNLLPTDFAFPLGLPGNRGYRLLRWRTGE